MFATLAPHVRTGALILTLRGRLDLSGVCVARRGLARGYAHWPPSIVVDAVAVRPGRRAANLLFPVLLRRAARVCGSALVVCTGSAALGRRLTRVRRRATGRGTGRPLPRVYGTSVEALRDLSPYPQRSGVRRAYLHLRPTPQAPSDARRMTARMCRAWGLEAVLDAAELVVSELVSNAAEHAGTEIDVSVCQHGDELRVAVADRSPLLPRAAGTMPLPLAGDGPRVSVRGRGFPLINHYTRRWGVLSGEHGKLVWASIAVPRAGRWRLAAVRDMARRTARRWRAHPVAARPRLRLA